ncbi:LytR/AlgR family response regulator transcription factor [Mesorhizobium sp. IMUNJ 23232]|uniref:LytR/AlgR family response regulator transcription factor n=1 Tax=Mesorhizobium sp. IMUNJ 23232 TaxID=3376064 RepID=UPI00379A628D
MVFVTAHDLYALKAFDVAALDFLLKPVDPDRLAVTIDRLRRHKSAAVAPIQQQRTSADTAHLSEQRLHLRVGGQSTIVALNKITLLKAEEDFTRIFVAGERDHLVCRLLRHFEAQLPTPPFFRVSRSLIVNLARLENVRWLGSGRCSFSVDEGIEPISLGRDAAQRLRRCIDEIGMVSA